MEEKNGTKAAASAPVKQDTPLMLIKKGVVDIVAAKVNQFIQNGELFLPKNYSPDNAMKSAWLILQATEDKDHNKALDVCTRDSIANALLDMVVQGLNPGKKQCYFIVYGKVLTCQRSYFGSQAVSRMVQTKIDDFASAIVYEEDKFSYGIKNGKKTVTEHSQEFGNVDKKKIVGAYSIALDKDGEPFRTEIMTFDEIKTAWRQSKMNPFSESGEIKEFSTHGKFTGEMALKTVINRLCKAIINASSDNALLLERINRAEDLSDRAAAETEIEELADKGPVLEIASESKNEGNAGKGPEQEQPDPPPAEKEVPKKEEAKEKKSARTPAW